MDPERETFDRVLDALAASGPDQDFSRVMSIIKAGTEAQISKRNESFEVSAGIIASRRLVTDLLHNTLGRLITRLSNDKDNMSSILSILNYIYSFLCLEYNPVRGYRLPEHLGEILKSRQNDKLIINKCLRLIATLCRYDESVANYMVKNEIRLNIIKSIVCKLWLVLEKNVLSQTTLKLSLSSLYEILKHKCSSRKIIDKYRIVEALDYAVVKFIDDWKTSEENHDVLTLVMQMFKLCSDMHFKNIFSELENTCAGNTIRLLSDLIVMPAVTETVTMFVLNLQLQVRRIHYLHDVALDEIYSKMIEKLQDSNAYPNGTDDELYQLFLRNFCMLLKASCIPEYLIVIATVALLNALQSHVRPTEVSFKNCQKVIITLNQDKFKCCLHLMLDSGILSILSSKLDLIFGDENRLDLHHNKYASLGETDFKRFKLLADRNQLKRGLALEIVNLIDCFVNLKPAALELGTSDVVYKLLLFFQPKNEPSKPQNLKLTIRNIITKPELLINLLTQAQFVYTVKRIIPKHLIVKCMELSEIRHLVMKELTKIVERTIEKGDIAHNLYTTSPTVKETLVVALPFLAENISILNNVMINCGGLDLVIGSLRRETAQREFIFCSLKALAHKIEIKDPTVCCLKDNNVEVATVLKIENYQPSAGRIVIFKLDDDSCVQANRELLASKSDFFDQLLFGQFKEAHLEVMRLPETQQNSFKLVLMLLQLDDIVTNDKLCRNGGKALEGVDLSIVLEAIVLCHRFLLKELFKSLTRFVVHCQFSVPSVIYIHRWLFDLPVDILRTEIISYCLVKCMSENQQSCLLDELFKPEYKERFLDDIRNMFRRFLYASCD